ncbi:SDR family NAD(P)-dependent oxidoreductase, partial [Streptomyces asiaticus]
MAVPSFRLDDSVALVTGAGSGIGRRLAIGLAEMGADVGCLDLPRSDLAGTAEAIAETGRRAVVLPADVTRAEDLAEAVARVERELGPLRLAVNAAGIANAAPAEDMPVEQWNKVIEAPDIGPHLREPDRQASADAAAGSRDEG